MKMFGLELELFYSKDGETILVPPAQRNIPVDAFAGVVELRSCVSSDPYECYGDIVQKRLKVEHENDCQLVDNFEHKFSASELVQIRRNGFAPIKDRQTNINNLYGKKPKLLAAGRAIASLQINISQQLGIQYTRPDGAVIPAQYGLVDIPTIVCGFDTYYAKQITAAKRAPGWYAIKDNIRLEYRSLPNSSFDVVLPSIIRKIAE